MPSSEITRTVESYLGVKKGLVVDKSAASHALDQMIRDYPQEAKKLSLDKMSGLSFLASKKFEVANVFSSGDILLHYDVSAVGFRFWGYFLVPYRYLENEKQFSKLAHNAKTEESDRRVASNIEKKLETPAIPDSKDPIGDLIKRKDADLSVRHIL